MATYSWPSSGGTAGSNPSVSPTGQAIPSFATLVGGENPTGNLMALQTDANGYLYISLAGSGVEPIPVSQSGVWNITNITGTVSLPTGASTATLQTNGNSSLTTIATNTTNLTLAETAPGTPASFALTVQGNASGIAIPVSISGSTGDASINIDKYGGSSTTLGQKAAAASIPVVIASDQVVPISATSLPLPTGAATSSNQTNGSQLTGLVAGTAIIGKVGIDQTTPGTTNGVQINAALPEGTNTIGTTFSQALQGTLTDNSGTTSGTPGTSTQVMASNASRKYLLIQDVSTTATIWINFTSAAGATNGSYQLLPGGSFVQESGFVSTEAVNILSTVASVPYTAKQA